MLEIRAVSLKSYPDVAAFAGINGNELLDACGIPRVALNDPEARLPAGAVVHLLESSARLSGCDSFGIRMAQCRSFASLGPLSLLLQHQKDIRHVMDALAEFRRTLSDTLIIGLEESLDSAMLIFDLIPPYNEPQAVDLTVGLAYLTLVGASQARWSPDVVHFTRDVPVDEEEFARFFQTKLEYNSSFNGFSCTLASLRIPLPLANKAMAANAKALLQKVPPPAAIAAYSDQVRRTIVLLLPSSKVSLERVATAIGHPLRTVQRNLKSEGCTFAEILNEVRREHSRRYLHASGLNLTYIAHALGYSCLSSFTRWFNSEFGMPPGQWRKEQRVRSH